MKRSDQEPRCYLATIGSQKRPLKMRIKRAWNATLRSLPSDDTFLGVTIFTGVIVMCSGVPWWIFLLPFVIATLGFLIRFVGLIITNANIDNDRP